MKRINLYDVQLVKESGKLYDLESKKIVSPTTAAEIIEMVFGLRSKTREHFVMLTLNIKNEVIGAHQLHIGTVNSSIVGPRDVYQQAILNNASGIIVAHNHPSGHVTPSKEDILMTERLVKSGEILGVELIDHLIIGDNTFTSLKEKGYIE